MRFAKTHETRKGVKLRLIGQWKDLAAYYEGEDGNAYSFSACIVGAGFVNCGPVAEFRATFNGKYRGELST